MKKGLFLIFTIILLTTGCKGKNDITVNFNCNGIAKDYDVHVGSKFTCDLFAQKFVMTIKEINDDKFIVESDNPLSEIAEDGSINSNSLQTIFEIKKGEKTNLAVPLDGLLYTIEFNW